MEVRGTVLLFPAGTWD